MTFGDPHPRWTVERVADAVRRRSLGMEVLGGALVVLGLIALSYVMIASVATTLLLGGLLLVSGVAQIAAAIAYWRRRDGGFALGVLLGGLCVVAGLCCLVFPAASLAALTLVLGCYFIATGVARVWISVRERFPGWGWAVVSALAEFLLGTLTLAGWPRSSLFLLGALLGIQLILSGVTAFLLGSTVRGILAPRGGAVETRRPATRFQH
jgi:uncharacterized membrane protein HdeD (DUF308 family)